MESPSSTQAEKSPNASSPSDERRPTRPGTKRLAITLSVLLSFLLALPFLHRSTAIHRSPLPSAPTAALPLSPLRLRALFLRPGNSSPDDAPRLHRSLTHAILSRTPTSGFLLSVTVDTPAGCSHAGDAQDPRLCGSVEASDLGGESGDVDELLESRVGGGGAVYTVVVAEESGEQRAVVGRHRHAWIVGPVEESSEVVAMAGKIFADYFINGGMEKGEGKEGDFVPVGSHGNIILSFSLLNANPNDWVYDWDFEKISETTLSQVLEALGPIANISLESQVLYHAPKSSLSYWDGDLKSYAFSFKDLPFFVNSNEWHLDTSLAAIGRSKILHFVVYVPSAVECPLLLRLPNGEISKTNGFISPMWGGVVVWNPFHCPKKHQGEVHIKGTISSQDLQDLLQVFTGQLRLLFGFRSNNWDAADGGVFNFISSARGFTQWELDVLYRHHASFNLLSCVDTLDSLSKLVQSLPRMIVLDEIGKQVKLSLEAANLAQKNAFLGIYDASAAFSRKARALAEDVFFHPSIMSISYASIEHYFAIYMPFFAPVSLHVLLAAAYELRRYRRELAKYKVFIADLR